MLQILHNMRPSARILSTSQRGGNDLTPLAIRSPGDGQRDLAIALINQGGPVELELSLQHAQDLDRLEVYLTDDEHDQSHPGHVELDAGHGQVFLPSRSIVTLAPAAAPDEAD